MSALSNRPGVFYNPKPGQIVTSWQATQSWGYYLDVLPEFYSRHQRLIQRIRDILSETELSKASSTALKSIFMLNYLDYLDQFITEYNLPVQLNDYTYFSSELEDDRINEAMLDWLTKNIKPYRSDLV